MAVNNLKYNGVDFNASFNGVPVEKAYYNDVVIFETTAVDSVLVSGLVSYFNPDTIDASAVSQGNSITTWNDAISGNNATQTGTARPTLNLNGQEKEVKFNGSNQWLSLGAPLNLDFRGGTDTFSIVIKIGSILGSQGYFISKATTAAATRQYGVYLLNGQVGVIIGGTSNNTNGAISNNDLIVLNVSLTGYNLYINNVLSASNQPIGSYFNSHNVEIGTRSSGGYLQNGSTKFIAIYNRELTNPEMTAIYNQYQ